MLPEVEVPFVVAGVVVVFDLPPHQLLFGFVVVVVVDLVVLLVVAGTVFVALFFVVVAGAVVVVLGVTAFVLFDLGQVQVGEAVPSLHICTPVVLLHEATPPWPAQHAA